MPKKVSFAVIGQFFGGDPKLPFFDNLAKKHTQKHYKNRGSAKHFLN